MPSFSLTLQDTHSSSPGACQTHMAKNTRSTPTRAQKKRPLNKSGIQGWQEDKVGGGRGIFGVYFLTKALPDSSSAADQGSWPCNSHSPLRHCNRLLLITGQVLRGPWVSESTQWKLVLNGNFKKPSHKLVHLGSHRKEKPLKRWSASDQRCCLPSRPREAAGSRQRGGVLSTASLHTPDTFLYATS